MLVVATPGGFQSLREKETIVLKSHRQLKEAKGGSFHVCTEMSKQFIQTLLKCANSPQPVLVSSYGYRDTQQREFWVADYPLWWWSVMICRLGADWHQSDTGVSYGLCAACMERPCLCLRQNTSACGVAQTLSVFTLLLESSWKSGLLESGLGPASDFFVSLAGSMSLSVI